MLFFTQCLLSSCGLEGVTELMGTGQAEELTGIKDGHSAVTSHLCGSLGHHTVGVKSRVCSEYVHMYICTCSAYEPVDMPHGVHRDQGTSLGAGPHLPP